MNYRKAEVISKGLISIENYLPEIGIDSVKDEIIAGLKAPSKYISSKFFYDRRGSELFEQITTLEEYYPTRTEKGILSNIVPDLNLNYADLHIVELGSGDHSKISLLLNQIPQSTLSSITYVPVDISQSAIETASINLSREFQEIKILGIVADFVHQLSLIPQAQNRLFCFFGSTIGNLNRNQMEGFMQLMGSEMKSGESFLLGMDMVKDIGTLESAYNDDQQFTSDFNKNILNVVNELVNTHFNVNNFEHLAFYNVERARIEMHLRAKQDLEIQIGSSSEKIRFKKGETIHTENSHKFNKEHIREMASWADLHIEKVFSDPDKLFSLVQFKKY